MNFDDARTWQRPDRDGPNRSGLGIGLFVLWLVLACGLIPQPSIAAFVSRADPEFRKSIAFADMSACETRILLGQLVRARRNCQSAAHFFATAHLSTVLKQTQALLARIDLAQGHADRALRSLNQVPDRGGVDLPPRQIAPSYFLRARSQSALNDYPSAYQDLNRFVQRYSEENQRDREQQVPYRPRASTTIGKSPAMLRYSASWRSQRSGWFGAAGTALYGHYHRSGGAPRGAARLDVDRKSALPT